MAFPIHCHSLGFKNLYWSHSSLGAGKVCFGAGQPKPHEGPNVILPNSKTLHIEQAQIVPALACSPQVRDVVRSLSVPFGGQNVILFYTLPIFIHLSQAALRVRTAVCRSSSEPLQRFLKVGLSKPALFIGSAEPKLRPGVSALSFGQKCLPVGFGPLLV
jgi:hypothetical protein